MKIRTSYFYQIRNFKKNMIPVSTAMWDPKWFHDFNNYNTIFKDKRGIINGIRLLPVIVQDKCHCYCPCDDKNPDKCTFLKKYRNELDKINFNQMIKDMEQLAIQWQKVENIQEEPIIVLIVYETPNNLCSERKVLIEYFNDNGIECKELEYPIV